MKSTKRLYTYPKFQESLEEESEDIGSPFQSPTARGEGLTEVPTEGPTLTPVQVGITEPATENLSHNLPLSQVNPELTTETMVKTEESQPSKKKRNTTGGFQFGN